MMRFDVEFFGGMILGLAVGLVLGVAVAQAHDHPGPGDWINKNHIADPVTDLWCCNDKDCLPQPAGAVSEVAGGFRVNATGEVIPHERIIWKSPDGRWWRCEERWIPARGLGTTRCLIGPPPNS